MNKYSLRHATGEYLGHLNFHSLYKVTWQGTGLYTKEPRGGMANNTLT